MQAAEPAVRVALKGQARTARGSHERPDVSRMKMFEPLLERPTMTNRDPIPPGAVLVALDIAKLRNEVLIEVPGQQRRRCLPVIQRRLGDPVLSRQVRRLRPRLLLAQNPDDLLFREPPPLHRPPPSFGPDSKSIWRKSSGAGQNSRVEAVVFLVVLYLWMKYLSYKYQVVGMFFRVTQAHQTIVPHPSPLSGSGQPEHVAARRNHLMRRRVITPDRVLAAPQPHGPLRHPCGTPGSHERRSGSPHEFPRAE